MHDKPALRMLSAIASISASPSVRTKTTGFDVNFKPESLIAALQLGNRLHRRTSRIPSIIEGETLYLYTLHAAIWSDEKRYGK